MHHIRTGSLLGAVLLSTATLASASSISFTLDFTFSGTPPSGAPTVTVDDGGGVGSATVTINAGGLSGTEFMDDIYLNYAGDLSSLSASYVSGVMANSVSFGTDAFKADGDGFYDVLIDYPPPPGGAAFTFGAGEMSSYLFTGAGLTANLFNVPSLCDQGCGNGSFFAASHVQAIAGGLSGWVGDGNGGPPPPPPPSPVPEPASLLLFGSGAVGLVARLRKKRVTAAE
jgi:PEP-CTERM motif